MAPKTLNNKNALVYGAAGSLGSAISKAMAEAGANVWLAGRNLESVQRLADEITASGGCAVAEKVDATNEKEVRDFVDRVESSAGSVDISFCLIHYCDRQGMLLADLPLEDFLRPVHLAMSSQFLTSTAAARVMMRQRSGVILSLTATPAAIGYPMTGGFGAACAAIENLSRHLASELGPYGIRAVNIRSGGSPDSQYFIDALKRDPENARAAIRSLEDDTMLKRLPLMNDIAQAAVFLASENARCITGVTVDSTAGSVSGLNYKTQRTN